MWGGETDRKDIQRSKAAMSNNLTALLRQKRSEVRQLKRRWQSERDVYLKQRDNDSLAAVELAATAYRAARAELEAFLLQLELS